MDTVTKTFIFSLLIVTSVSIIFMAREFRSVFSPKDEFIIGVYSQGYPYAFINHQGELDGFDVELAHRIACKLGKKIVFSDMPYQLLVTSIKQGNIDIISASAVITKKKMQEMDMIDIYGKPKPELTLIFWQYIPKNIYTIDNLRNWCTGKPLVMRIDMVWQEILEEHGITNIMLYEELRDLVLPIKYGTASAAVVGPRHAIALQKKHPEIKILKIPLDKPWGEGIGICLKKENIELKKKLEVIIEKFKADGTIDALKAKWFGHNTE